MTEPGKFSHFFMLDPRHSCRAIQTLSKHHISDESRVTMQRSPRGRSPVQVASTRKDNPNRHKKGQKFTLPNLNDKNLNASSRRPTLDPSHRLTNTNSEIKTEINKMKQHFDNFNSEIRRDLNVMKSDLSNSNGAISEEAIMFKLEQFREEVIGAVVEQCEWQQEKFAEVWHKKSEVFFFIIFFFFNVLKFYVEMCVCLNCT